MVIRLEIEPWVISKGGNKLGVRKRYGGCLVLFPLCMLGCISTVVAEGACVRDCQVCSVGIVGSFASGVCVGGRNSVMTAWGRMGGKTGGKRM
jgi:hypothetical protein